ncbi:MAG TPA: C25 family cysteine peptidase [Kiritimatiellia bacterium]|nr:C25 family cysteine peptidase [Kiritimatiellia bacterium]HMO97743.1 C25 family cysteine peptidase [Kiritimatiellia bacterium]
MVFPVFSFAFAFCRYSPRLFLQLAGCALGLLLVHSPGQSARIPDSVNHFSLTPDGSDGYTLRFVFPDYQLEADDLLEFSATVQGAVSELDGEGRATPSWVQVLEIPGGRSVAVESDAIRTRLIPLAEGVAIPAEFSLSEDEAPVSASIGRMGGRVFLRVAVHPVRVDSTRGRLLIIEELTARLVVSEEAPMVTAAAPAPAAPLSLLPAECAACPPPMPVGITPGVGLPGQFFPRRSVTNDVAWKITLTEPGIYRLTGQELAAAGVPATFRDASQLRITARDQVIPVWRSTTGPMASNDWIAFYGAAVSSEFTTQNVYWLTTGTPSPPVPAWNASTNASAVTMTSVWSLVEGVTGTNIYDFTFQPLDESHDHWFIARIPYGTSVVAQFQTPQPVTNSLFRLEFDFFGAPPNTLTNVPDRRSEIRYGTNVLVRRDYTGTVRVTGTVATNVSLPTNGVTTFTFAQTNLLPNVGDALLKSMRLCYQRRLVVPTLPFFFNAATGAVNYRVEGFVSTNIWLVNVSDPFAPVQWTNLAVTAINGTNRLVFGQASAAGSLAIFNATNHRSVASITLTRFRGLADVQRQADYVMVTPREFRTSAFRLLKHRFKNDLRVQVASPDDVYNEFSFGVKDAAAIRQYFGYAYHHYQLPRPAYALLIGNGSHDPLRKTRHSDPEFIPTVQFGSNFQRTSFEQWFVTVDGVENDGAPDRLPDLMLGRIPATNELNLSRLVNKLIHYETATNGTWWMETALLVADKKDQGQAGDYGGFSESNTLIHLTNGGFDPTFGISKSYLDASPASAIKSNINTIIHDGVHIINYMGHGSRTVWSLDNVWDINDASSRTNTTAYPIIVTFTCNTGAFQLPASRSMAEAIIHAQHSGSAAVAPTALALHTNSTVLADGFYEAFAVQRVPRLGMAMQEGRLRLWTFNKFARENMFYAIFGDPAQQVWGGAKP